LGCLALVLVSDYIEKCGKFFSDEDLAWSVYVWFRYFHVLYSIHCHFIVCKCW